VEESTADGRGVLTMKSPIIQGAMHTQQGFPRDDIGKMPLGHGQGPSYATQKRSIGLGTHPKGMI
jgi:hypothetical protein